MGHKTVLGWELVPGPAPELHMQRQNVAEAQSLAAGGAHPLAYPAGVLAFVSWDLSSALESKLSLSLQIMLLLHFLCHLFLDRPSMSFSYFRVCESFKKTFNLLSSSLILSSAMSTLLSQTCTLLFGSMCVFLQENIMFPLFLISF